MANETTQAGRSAARRARLDGAASSPTPTNAIESNVVKEHEPSAEERYKRIAEAAYRRAEARDFAPGREIEDWLAAEREVDADVTSEPSEAARDRD